ncbi:hypothetical protein JCM10449v2_002464 [Rhodotorula kratochvilovae]
MSTAHLSVPTLFNVNGLVALISGGGTGIGLMATQALAANGAKVYIVGRRQEALDRVVEVYGPLSKGQIIPLVGDVTKKEDVLRLAAEIKEREGGLHILINNAGISGPRTPWTKDTPVEQLSHDLLQESEEGWADVFRTNTTSIYYMSVAFLPLLHKFTFGGDAAGRAIYEKYQTGIINITSISGLVKVAQNHFCYNASKAAANHLHRMMATEFAHTGVRVNSIAPGLFPTEMTARGKGSDANNKTDLGAGWNINNMDTPADRPGSDEDLGGTVLYLSSRAGQYTQGQIIAVDGGVLETHPSCV